MIGQTISHYKILEKLGEGGMGVVYKAQDTTLDRFVALKFLPQHLAASDQDKARFVQEAKAAAALNHPNICSVIAIEECDGQMFIVMEFVDGQTLREKLTANPPHLKSAIEIGIQIADGLAAAHEKGIVHRDIKPENIMVRKDGICQIMDFGLAKLRASGSKITRLTKEGSTLGTAGYMSPEQVMGLDADHRSDIFSLGVLMYEMFTGQLPFKGVHETALSYEIVNVDPAPLSSISPQLDPNLDIIVLDCLEKDPVERCQSVAEVGRDLRRVKRESTRQKHSRITAGRPAYPSTMIAPDSLVQVPSAERPAGSRSRLPWYIASGCIALALGVLMYHLFSHQPVDTKNIVRFTFQFPEKGSFARQAPAISPNGQMIAFVGSDSSGKSSLWVRSLASITPRSLAGTDEANFPFWSPDSRFIAFFSDGKLKKVDANGGPVQSICDAPEGRGGSWGSAGIILFAPSYGSGLMQVSGSGGIPSYVTSLDTSLKEESHRWPFFMPDGRHFLYMRRGSTEKSGIYMGAIDQHDYSLVLPSTTNVVYVEPGYLLFLREGTLMAQQFDIDKGQLRGEPVSLADDVGGDIGYNFGFFSSSSNGTLVLGAGGGISSRQLFLYDRQGKRLAALGRPGRLFDFALSPDERRIVFRRVDASTGNNDLWILDLTRMTESRFTFAQSLDDDPVWSPDGNSIVFDSNPDGVSNIHRKVSTGAGQEELLLKSPNGNYCLDYSSDGRFILYNQDRVEASRTTSTLWVLPLTGDQQPILAVQGQANVAWGKFSPDARWLVYQSNESGREEIYVQAFPATQGKWQVSTNGGGAPQWSRDGKQIYYVSPTKKLMAVDVKTEHGSIEMGIPTAWFDIDIDRYTAPNRFVVTRDGQRVIVNLPSEGAAALPLRVVLNWTNDFPKR